MAPPRFLRLLGRPALLDEFGAPLRFKSQKHLALLAYLQLEGRGRPMRRDRLADFLWPGDSLTRARHSLGVAISALRVRVDPAGFPADQSAVQMTLTLPTDLERLERGQFLASDLEPALDLDGFLEDLDIRNAPAFDQWRDECRARYWPQIEAALVRQMDHCRRTGDSTGIHALADRTLRHNPLSEPAIRARMEAHAFAGDRIGALRTFEQWRQALLETVRAEPSEAMQMLARRLRRGTREGGGDGTRPRIPAEQWRDRPFIGRAQEYRTLYEAWERATREAATFAFVVGESGIGKSTLLHRLLTAVSLEGAVTSRVQCYELEREIPYAALGALVRGLLERPEARATSPQALADLAQAVPAIRDRFSGLPESLPLHGESFRIRVTDATEALVRAIAEETPVFLVVDDLHLIDDASASVLHLLARRFEEERVMLAFAARLTTQQESPNFVKLRESHRRLGFVSLEVPPMAEDEARAMLDGLLADAPDPGRAVREAMLRAARGYPMALELLTGEWRASGEDSLALAVPAMREVPRPEAPPEDAYRLALDRICEGLDGPTRLVLQLASLLGPRLNDFGMYRIITQGIAEVGAAMETLSVLRLLRETEDRLEFVNELIRGHVYMRMPSPLRLRLHHEVANDLLAVEAGGGHAPGLEIAWHLIRAGRRNAATPYLLRGARESMRGGAPYEAERGLITALDRLDEPEKSEALLLIGEAMQEQGRMEESVGYLDQVTTAVSEDLLSRRNVLRLYAGFAIHDRSRQTDDALVAQLLAEVDRATVPSTRLKGLWFAASRPREEHDPALVRSILRKLESIDVTRLTPEDAGEHALGISRCLYDLGDIPGCSRAIESMLPTLEREGINNSVYRTLLVALAVVRSTAGDYEIAHDIACRAFAISKKAGDDRRAKAVAVNAAVYCSRLGDAQAELSWTANALARDFAPGEQILKLRCLHHRAHALAMLNREREARETLQQAIEISTKSSSSWLRQMSLLMSADLLLMLGSPSDAEAAAVEALNVGDQELLADSMAGRFARWAARLGVNGLLSPDSARSCLAALQKREGSLDKIDQAELLNSIVWLESKLGPPPAPLVDEMRDRLGRLPQGVSNELARMGML